MTSQRVCRMHVSTGLSCPYVLTYIYIYCVYPLVMLGRIVICCYLLHVLTFFDLSKLQSLEPFLGLDLHPLTDPGNPRSHDTYPQATSMKPRRRRSRTAVLRSVRTGAWNASELVRGMRDCVFVVVVYHCLPVSCEHQRLHPSGDSSDVEGFGDCNIAVYTYNASITGSHEHWLPTVWEGLKHQEREYKLNLQYTCHQYQVISSWWFHTHFLLYIPGEEDPS